MTTLPARKRDGEGTPPRAVLRDYSSLRYLLPALVLYLVIVLAPIVGGLPLSLVSWNGVSHPIFRGLANFGSVLTSHDFATALGHTALILLIFFVLANTVGIGIALLLHSRPRGYRLYQALIFLPAVVSLVATGFIWTLMLDPTIGLLPATLNALHLNSINELWLANPRFALLTVTFVAWWQWGGIPS